MDKRDDIKYTDYTLIRSGRRTVAVEIRPDGSVVVRAPYRLGDRRIQAFVDSRRPWIERHRSAMAQRRQELAAVEPLTPAEQKALLARARTELAALTAALAPLVGVTYGKITIRRQRTRWGSCSARGDLSFNCLLLLAPERVREYVVIHELCHRKVMDHSARFWAEVERACPDWRERRKWLRDNGSLLLARLGDPTGK